MVARVRPADNITYLSMDDIMGGDDVEEFIDAVQGRDIATKAVNNTNSPNSPAVGDTGNKRGRGRPRGSQNKVNIALKEALILSANLEGFDRKGKDGLVGFLRRLSRDEPRSYAALLGRVVPLHIVGSVDHTHRVIRSKEEVVKELEQRGLPVNMVYDGTLDQWTPEDDKIEGDEQEDDDAFD